MRHLARQNSPICSRSLVPRHDDRRILANRQSAQRSRVRKLQYISELERSVTSLQVRAELCIFQLSSATNSPELCILS